jgi:hypothetical protein
MLTRARLGWSVLWQEPVMSFGLYVLGVVVVLAGLIYGAHLMHVPAHWIAVGAIVIAGLGILTGVKNTRQKDPS